MSALYTECGDRNPWVHCVCVFLCLSFMIKSKYFWFWNITLTSQSHATNGYMLHDIQVYFTKYIKQYSECSHCDLDVNRCVCVQKAWPCIRHLRIFHSGERT